MQDDKIKDIKFDQGELKEEFLLANQIYFRSSEKSELLEIDERSSNLSKYMLNIRREFGSNEIHKLIGKVVLLEDLQISD
jgi:hypothetical protein